MTLPRSFTDSILTTLLQRLGVSPDAFQPPLTLDDETDPALPTITDALGTVFRLRVTEEGRCVELV